MSSLSKIFRFVSLLVVLTLILAFAHPPHMPGVTAQAASPASPQDTPFELISEGVTTYTIASPRLFWHTGVPVCPPVNGPAGTLTERIRRTATYGWDFRTLFSRETDCNQQDLLSNIVSDGSYLYWMSAGFGSSWLGLVRLSVNANPGDMPTPLTNSITGNVELAIYGGTLYMLTLPLSPAHGALYAVDTTLFSVIPLVADAGEFPSNLQTDGQYVYWNANGVLNAYHTYYQDVSSIDSGVFGYYPEGYGVFYGKGNQVIFYSNFDDTYTPLYTSPEADTLIPSVAADGSFLFFFEKRLVPCSPQPCFPTYNYVLVRSGRDGSSPAQIYAFPAVYEGEKDLKADGDFLFWRHEGGSLVRLPKNALALPMTDMGITGLEVIQAIQELDNSVLLVAGKRTFVRMFVKSFGARDVPNVTARLFLTDMNGSIQGSPLVPVNPAGTKLRVYTNPSRGDINQSFLFELPWDWVDGSKTVYLRGELNPYRFPLQSDYRYNTMSVGPFTFQESPRLDVQFVSWGYTLNGKLYSPRLVEDIFQAYSFVRRAYPLASAPGFYGNLTPGFRPNLWFVIDNQLGSRVDQTAKECAVLSKEDRNLCASDYTNSRMRSMRSEWGVPENMFMYGMILEAPGFFPRGQEQGGGASSGPTGSERNWGWDFDGSYGDWYAAHEIGHSLGRGHPSPNSDDPNTPDITEGCGHSRSDPNYPYDDAFITGFSGDGFDAGDPGLNSKLKMKVYPGLIWHDVMSYCNNQWVSDYTYEGMYSTMIANTQKASAAVQPMGIQISGDFLSLYGSIFPESNTATFTVFHRVNSVASIPALVPGDYTIRLLAQNNTLLADYAFTPEAAGESDGSALSYGQVVDFLPGTAQVQIVRDSDQLVLASKAISSNSPTVTNVQISGGSPITGTAALSWQAADADGDPLNFDIFYSRDGGLTLSTRHHR